MHADSVYETAMASLSLFSSDYNSAVVVSRGGGKDSTGNVRFLWHGKQLLA